MLYSRLIDPRTLSSTLLFVVSIFSSLFRCIYCRRTRSPTHSIKWSTRRERSPRSPKQARALRRSRSILHPTSHTSHAPERRCDRAMPLEESTTSSAVLMKQHSEDTPRALVRCLDAIVTMGRTSAHATIDSRCVQLALKATSCYDVHITVVYCISSSCDHSYTYARKHAHTQKNQNISHSTCTLTHAHTRARTHSGRAWI